MLSHRQYFLTKLMEECAEVQKRASKQIQYGSSETQPGVDGTNAERLRDEVYDLLCILDILYSLKEVEIDQYQYAQHKQKKVERLAYYLKYAQHLGYVDPSPFSLFDSNADTNKPV